VTGFPSSFSSSRITCRFGWYIYAELREAGFTVYEEGTGDSGKVLLQSPMRVDVVMTDVRMPGKTNGIELAAFVRRDRPPIKVIVMSGDYRPRPEDPQLFDGFFPKPLDYRLLFKTIEAWERGTRSRPARSIDHGQG